jgi:tartrate dehydratase beta subunit/fumarate hydratase class I family protein
MIVGKGERERESERARVRERAVLLLLMGSTSCAYGTMGQVSRQLQYPRLGVLRHMPSA